MNRLQKLNLRENELENDGAAAVAQGLSQDKQLRMLDVAQNQVQPLFKAYLADHCLLRRLMLCQRKERWLIKREGGTHER